MIWHSIKTIYFATICIPPPFLLFLYPALFFWRLHVPTEALTIYTFYFWVGLVLVLLHLWTLREETNTKAIWTILVIIFGVVTLPIYWFRFVLRDYKRV
jgi:hypothetical protein